MRRSGPIFWSLMAVLFALSIGSNAAQAQNCQNLLCKNAYRCTVTSDFGTQFEDCFCFRSPGRVSEKFDLYVAGLGQWLGCDCKAGGTPNDPKFHTSQYFFCTAQFNWFYPIEDASEAQEFPPLGISFVGKVVKKLNVGLWIRQGSAVNEYGDSFVYSCVLDPKCKCRCKGSPDSKSSANPYIR